MFSYSVSAPGKIILHGEHSVVYGKNALVSAIGLRTNLIVKETNLDSIHIEFPNLQFKIEILLRTVNEFLRNSDGSLEKVKDFVRDEFNRSKETENNTLVALFSVLWKALEVGHLEKAFDLSIQTELRIGAGSGSSAAFGVCIATAFLLLGKKIDPLALDYEKISNLAFESEKIMHMNPSGVDNTICTYGGLIRFAKGKPFSNLNIPKGHQLNILLVDTGVSRNTAKLVGAVSDLRKQFPALFDSIFDSMNLVVEEAVKEYSQFNGEISEIGKLFDINNGLLRTIGVSHPSLEQIFMISIKNGFSSKITGAGGGGYALILLPTDYKSSENFKQLLDDLKGAGFETIETVVGGRGVNVEIL